MAGQAAQLPRVRNTALRVDVALVVVHAIVVSFGVWTELLLWPSPVAFPAGAYLIGLAASALLILRRRHPVWMTAALLVMILGYHLAGYPGGAPTLVLFSAVYAIAAYGRSLWSAAIGVAFVLGWQIIPALPPTALPWDSFATTGPAMGMAAMILIGASAGQLRRAHLLNLQVVAESAEARMRQTLTDERLDIARELHDVLAHTISAISVQSGVALDAFDDDPAQARSAIATVRTLARQAIPELRSTLELLRSDGSAATATGQALSTPRLAEAGSLLRGAEEAGLTVTANIDVPDGLLTPVEELTAYRIVQEALTNVIRHAEARTVLVFVTVADGSLTVTVEDDGRGTGGSRVPGLGLRGMRERVQALGGRFGAADRVAGGFEVSAVMPLGARSGRSTQNEAS